MSDRFDPDKDAINRDRHGLPLIFGDAIMADPDHLIIPSIRPEDGEERFKAVGLVDGKLYTVVFVWRVTARLAPRLRRHGPALRKAPSSMAAARRAG